MGLTRTNENWLHDLMGGGMEQETAIAELRQILLRAVLYFFNRNLSDLGNLARKDILQMAEDCAQEALISVINHLSDFRGDSKFTTWAYRFGINSALMAARRERWKGVSLDGFSQLGDGEVAEWLLRDKSFVNAPDRSAMIGEVREIIRDVIERDLTERQRQVLFLIVFNEVPMDVVVTQLNTNRNAIYKLLHDARRKLKNGLQARGFEVGETLALFRPAGQE